jgi:hypothetical protein
MEAFNAAAFDVACELYPEYRSMYDTVYCRWSGLTMEDSLRDLRWGAAGGCLGMCSWQQPSSSLVPGQHWGVQVCRRRHIARQSPAHGRSANPTLGTHHWLCTMWRAAPDASRCLQDAPHWVPSPGARCGDPPHRRVPPAVAGQVRLPQVWLRAGPLHPDQRPRGEAAELPQLPGQGPLQPQQPGDRLQVGGGLLLHPTDPVCCLQCHAPSHELMQVLYRCTAWLPECLAACCVDAHRFCLSHSDTCKHGSGQF